jgi:hypothetical protein
MYYNEYKPSGELAGYIEWLPPRKLVIVITAGNYNKWNIKNGSAQLSRQYIYPALRKNF